MKHIVKNKHKQYKMKAIIKTNNTHNYKMMFNYKPCIAHI